MKYIPDIAIHSPLEIFPTDEMCQKEPSLSLCDLKHFGTWHGPISAAVFEHMARTSSFQRICARGKIDPSAEIRVSTRTVWLEAGETPERPEWHIDRVGSYKQEGDIDMCDYAELFSFPSFLIASFLLPTKSGKSYSLDEASTEFFLTPFEGNCNDSWSEMKRMYDDVESGVSIGTGNRTLRSGDKSLVAYSERTVHRAGIAPVSGWRYMMRLGLFSTKSPRSPNEDQFVFRNSIWDGQRSFLRSAGRTNLNDNVSVRSVSLTQESGSQLARQFICDQDLAVAGSEDRDVVLETVKSAAYCGQKQCGSIK